MRRLPTTAAPAMTTTIATARTSTVLLLRGFCEVIEFDVLKLELVDEDLALEVRDDEELVVVEWIV